MMKMLLKYFITEICIELFFEKISSNFNCKPITYNSIHDFYVGQYFHSIEVIGQDRSIIGAYVFNINILDEYLTVKDSEGFTFSIDKNDIPRLRFIK